MSKRDLSKIYTGDLEVLKIWESVYDGESCLESDEDMDEIEMQIKMYLEQTKNVFVIPSAGKDFMVVDNPYWLYTYFTSEFVRDWLSVLECKYGSIGGTQWMLAPTLIITRDFNNRLKSSLPKSDKIYKKYLPPGESIETHFASRHWKTSYFENAVPNDEVDLDIMKSDMFEPRSMIFRSVGREFLGVPLVLKKMPEHVLPYREWGFLDGCRMMRYNELENDVAETR